MLGAKPPNEFYRSSKATSFVLVELFKARGGRGGKSRLVGGESPRMRVATFRSLPFRDKFFVLVTIIVLCRICTVARRARLNMFTPHVYYYV